MVENNSMSVTTEIVQNQEQFNDFISEDFFKKFEHVTHTFVTPLLCTAGLITNGLGVGVLWHDTKRQKLSIYFYLCGLTISDICYLALGLVRRFPIIIRSFDVDRAKFIDAHAKPAIIYLDLVFAHTSTAMIIVMSIERLLALTRPLTVKSTWFAKYPMKIILFCFSFNVLFMLPYPINMEVISAKGGNNTIYYLTYKSNGKGFMSYYLIIQAIVDNFMPISCLLVTNIAIPIKYYQFTKRRLANLNLTSGPIGNQQIKITSTIFTVTIAYLLLSCPLFLSKILSYADPEYSFDGKKKVVFWFLIELNNVLSYINAANDFVIYIIVSNHYRNIFKMKYCRCCKRGSTYFTDDGVISSGVISGQQMYFN